MTNRLSYFYFPLIIFCFIWIFVWIVHSISPIQLYDIDFSTILLSIASISSIILGYIFYRLFWLEDNFNIYNEFNIHSITVNYSVLFYSLIVLNLIVALSLYFYLMYLVDERGSVLKYFLNPIMSRQLVIKTMKEENWNFTVAIASYGVSLNLINLVLSGILFTSKKVIHKVTSVLPLIIGITVSFINFSRFNLIYVFMYWIFSILYFHYWLDKARRKRVFKSVIFLMLISVVLVGIVFYGILSMRFFTVSDEEIFKTFIEQAFIILPEIWLLSMFIFLVMSIY